jgi:acetylglutamate kinase
MEDPALVESVLRDIVLIATVGVSPVIVHGGGKAITRRMQEAGIQARFLGGLRVTDADSIRIVEEVLDTEINPGIVSVLERFGVHALGVAGRRVFSANKAQPITLPDGSSADLGFVGEICGTRADEIRDALRNGIIPVISPVAADASGQAFNVNADLAALHVAISLQASRLIYLSDVPGVLSNPKDHTTLIPSIRRSDVSRLRDTGVLSGGMLPKVQSALDALDGGVGKVQFIDGRSPHSLLLELFTDGGIGTEIVEG